MGNLFNMDNAFFIFNNIIMKKKYKKYFTYEE